MPGLFRAICFQKGSLPALSWKWVCSNDTGTRIFYRAKGIRWPAGFRLHGNDRSAQPWMSHEMRRQISMTPSTVYPCSALSGLSIFFSQFQQQEFQISNCKESFPIRNGATRYLAKIRFASKSAAVAPRPVARIAVQYFRDKTIPV